MSTPIVAGALAIVRQYFRQGVSKKIIPHLLASERAGAFDDDYVDIIRQNMRFKALY